MALWICSGCSTAYAVGQPACPECRSTDYAEEHHAMPKITVHGGATNDADETEADPVETPAALDTPEEESSPGSSSETSSSKPQSSSGPGTSSRRSRARTTESPS